MSGRIRVIWSYLDFLLTIRYKDYLILLRQFQKLIDLFCYDLKLGSDYNSDKDLSKSKEYDQLVKHKDIELYLYYIYL